MGRRRVALGPIQFHPVLGKPLSSTNLCGVVRGTLPTTDSKKYAFAPIMSRRRPLRSLTLKLGWSFHPAHAAQHLGSSEVPLSNYSVFPTSSNPCSAMKSASPKASRPVPWSSSSEFPCRGFRRSFPRTRVPPENEVPQFPLATTKSVGTLDNSRKNSVLWARRTRKRLVNHDKSYKGLPRASRTAIVRMRRGPTSRRWQMRPLPSFFMCERRGSTNATESYV